MVNVVIRTVCALSSSVLLMTASLEAFGNGAEAMHWEPPWRDRGDCGPVALYLLMRLEGRDTSIEAVKQMVPYDADRGCSLADLAVAADKMSFPVEIRFVPERDLPLLGVPFIYHAEGSLKQGTGHFGVVAGYSSKRHQFITVDTEFESSGWIPVENLSTSYSGYILIPKRSSILAAYRGYRLWIVLALCTAWGGMVLSERWRDGLAARQGAERHAAKSLQPDHSNISVLSP